MAKELNFDVTLRFSDKVYSDDEYKEIAENIGTAIVREAENYGIAPEDAEIYIEWVKVKHPLSGVEFFKSLYEKIFKS